MRDDVNSDLRQEYVRPTGVARDEPSKMEYLDETSLVEMSVDEIERLCLRWAINNTPKRELDRVPFELLSKDQLKGVNLNLLGQAKLKQVFRKHSLDSQFGKLTRKADLIDKINQFRHS